MNAIGGMTLLSATESDVFSRWNGVEGTLLIVE